MDYMINVIRPRSMNPTNHATDAFQSVQFPVRLKALSSVLGVGDAFIHSILALRMPRHRYSALEKKSASNVCSIE